MTGLWSFEKQLVLCVVLSPYIHQIGLLELKRRLPLFDNLSESWPRVAEAVVCMSVCFSEYIRS